MLGKSSDKRIPRFLAGQNAVVWTREYSWEAPEECNCEKLQSVLAEIPGAKRMVVGHTIQASGITTACDSKVYRIDVGMSKGCGDHDVQVLEILNDKDIRKLGWGADGKPKVLPADNAWGIKAFLGAVREAVGPGNPVAQ